MSRSFAAWHDYVYSVATPTRGAIEGLRVIARMQGELGDPGGVGVADLMSNLFGWIGDYDRELRLLEYIGEQDPERDQAGMHAYLALEQKDYERALEEGWRGLASFANDHYTMAFVIRATRATDGSSARIREHVTQYVPTLLARSPALTGVQGPLAVDFALLLRGEGEEDQAQRILEAVVARGESSSSELPRALAHLGRTREAIAALDALVADGLLFNSGADADWGALEELPRFQELVARGDAMRAGQRAEVQAMIERGELLMPTGEVL